MSTAPAFTSRTGRTSSAYTTQLTGLTPVVHPTGLLDMLDARGSRQAALPCLDLYLEPFLPAVEIFFTTSSPLEIGPGRRATAGDALCVCMSGTHNILTGPTLVTPHGACLSRRIIPSTLDGGPKCVMNGLRRGCKTPKMTLSFHYWIVPRTAARRIRQLYLI